VILLLDVNVLLAYQYPAHIHHGRTRVWISQMRASPRGESVVFATCPITELGFVRVGSGPAALAANVHAARADLRSLKSSEKTRFIPDDIPERDLPAWVRKPAHTIDGYLLALAKTHGGQLATLDRFIPGALLIPDEPSAPLEVREEGVPSGWTMPLRTGAESDSSASAALHGGRAASVTSALS
jgi:uncharacterized protein